MHDVMAADEEYGHAFGAKVIHDYTTVTSEYETVKEGETEEEEGGC